MSSGSMKVLGSLRDDSIAMFPATISSNYTTRVTRFLGDQEQRWSVRRALVSFVLQYKGVNGYDLSVIRAFFDEVMGRYVSDALLNTFKITLSGVEYQYCVFEQDEIETNVGRGETYEFELKIRQVRQNA